ncbi:class I SAM-dependent methyltransferase [Candidatus Dependentiae bacterium]|nr:MAG: class I SAM-dependent methyltransferase [Candidatus Dependentiae bacterium]
MESIKIIDRLEVKAMSKKDWDAQQYKEHSEPQQEGGQAIIAHYPFRGDEVVLDIGCGDGRTTAEIAAKLPDGNVIGIDPSPAMITEAQKSFLSVQNLSFIQASAEDFAFDFQFDLIVSFFALHYVVDHQTVLKKIYSALKPGGVFIVVMAGGDQPEVAEVFAREKWKALISEQEMVWGAKTEGEYRPLLEQGGFEIIETVTQSASRLYDSKEDLLNWALVWVPYVTGLDEEKSLQFSQEIVENIAKGQKGAIKSTSPLLYVKAQKL